MNTYHLYVKTHIKTGLKYLGYTSNKNPNTYLGSGKYWKLHLQKHGKEVDTKILHECHDKTEIIELGRYYSELWNIVESNEWANLKPEEGDGAASGEHNHMKRHYLREQASKRMLALGENHWNKTPEARAKRAGVKRPDHSERMKGAGNPMFGKKRERTRGSAGMKWYNNGVRSVLANECPAGYVAGRIYKRKC
jgi:hypothetical protein